MEQNKNDVTPLDEMLQNLIERLKRQFSPVGHSEDLHQLALVVSDTRLRLRGGTTRGIEDRRHLGERLDREIAERHRCQMEVTGRLAELERRFADDPDRMALGLQEFSRESARRPTDGAPGMADPFGDGLVSGSRNMRRLLDRHEHALAAALGIKPGERTMTGLIQDVQALKADVATYRARWESQAATIGHQRARNRDLEAQVAAVQKAVDDVWALVATPDGYGSPFWSEPGLDDTAPAWAIGKVLEHLRARDDESKRSMAELCTQLQEIYDAAGWTANVPSHTVLVKDIARLVSDNASLGNEVSAQLKRVGDLQFERATLKQVITDQAVQIARLRSDVAAFGSARGACSCASNDEAMAALNAADRQSDDDRICGC